MSHQLQLCPLQIRCSSPHHSTMMQHMRLFSSLSFLLGSVINLKFTLQKFLASWDSISVLRDIFPSKLQYRNFEAWSCKRWSMYARIMGTEIEGFNFGSHSHKLSFRVAFVWIHGHVHFACCVLRKFWQHKSLRVFPHCRLVVDGKFLVRIRRSN